MLGAVKRGERSGEAHFTYASPRNAFAFLTPCSVLLRKRNFAVCGQRPKGSALWKPATFEKVDETFTFVLI